MGDVEYPFFLANGRTADAARQFAVRPGQRIRLRLINGSGDTAFRVRVPGTPMMITHTDGFPVVPTRADAVLIGMGERVDAVIEVPDTAVPLLGLAEGKDGIAQVLSSPATGPRPTWRRLWSPCRRAGDPGERHRGRRARPVSCCPGGRSRSTSMPTTPASG